MHLKFSFFIILTALTGQIWAQTVISEANLRKDLSWLAADKRKGRGTGSKEELAAAQYLAKQFKKMGLQPKGDNGTWLHQFGFKKTVGPHGTEQAGAPQVYSQNVAAYLDNGAPYTIVIGAHYDHLGLGYDHNSLSPTPLGQIHNGADDNASGTAGLLELARYFSQNGQKERHNFLFLAFSGEELGLIGSKKYTDYPTIDLNTVSFMVNLDMIGRLNAEKRLLVGGVGTSPSFVPAIGQVAADLVIRQDSAGVGPSDHTSFYLKNIPVLFCFSGQHMDYHRPSDDVDKINFAGQKAILEFVVRMVEHLDTEPKLVFQSTKASQDNTPRFKVTLGVMPDYAYEGDGMRIDGVSEGRPAAAAGLQKGDIITSLGDQPVKNMQDYMKALAKYAKGDQGTVKFKRGTEEKSAQVTF
jgi:Peptidase family M28/PDZ domain